MTIELGLGAIAEQDMDDGVPKLLASRGRLAMEAADGVARLVRPA